MTVPAAAAAVVFTAGFGALTLFWTLGSPPAGLPGLFDFASATGGDGLVLPLMTGLLVYAVRALPPARGDRPFATAAALAGGGLGVASQAVWLAAPAPRPNWTLPGPHRFTAAGWYHAAFVVLVCAAIAALLALALNRAALAAHPPRRAVAAIAAGIAAGVCFIALLAADTRADATPDRAGAGLVGVLAGLVATLVTAAVVVRRRPGRLAVQRRVKR